MANFNRDNRSGGGRSYGNRSFSNDRPEMHQATCANCGKSCEVPFRPTGSKPVFCRDCFKNEGPSDSRRNEGSDSRRSDSRSFGSNNREDRQMFDAVCSNCGNDCQIPFRPSQGREVFCSRCFEKNEGNDTHRPERRSFDKPSFNRDDNRSRPSEGPNYKAQFEALNAKMDKILNLLTPTPVEVAPLESVLDEKVLEEIAEEVQDEGAEVVEKKPKKAKAATKKPAVKAKKAAAPKKK